MSTDHDTNRHLDYIAEAIGANGATAELLNAVHACRPGHPLNEATPTPFANLQFMLAGRRCRSTIPHTQLDWLDVMVANERDK